VTLAQTLRGATSCLNTCNASPAIQREHAYQQDNARNHARGEARRKAKARRGSFCVGLSYLNAGDEISAAQMNALVAELDDALTALLSGKSPLCFRPDYELQAGATTLLSIPFYFGDPSKRKILSGVSAQYDQSFFDTFVGTLQADGLNADTRRYIVKDTITPAQWESVRAMFGFQPGLATCGATGKRVASRFLAPTVPALHRRFLPVVSVPRG
jgi:hypothetical protein